MHMKRSMQHTHTRPRGLFCTKVFYPQNGRKWLETKHSNLSSLFGSSYLFLSKSTKRNSVCLLQFSWGFGPSTPESIFFHHWIKLIINADPTLMSWTLTCTLTICTCCCNGSRRPPWPCSNTDYWVMMGSWLFYRVAQILITKHL